MIFSYQDKERQQAQIGIVVEFAIAMIGKLDGINRHSFNNFRLRVGEVLQGNLALCKVNQLFCSSNAFVWFT